MFPRQLAFLQPKIVQLVLHNPFSLFLLSRCTRVFERGVQYQTPIIRTRDNKGSDLWLSYSRSLQFLRKPKSGGK